MRVMVQVRATADSEAGIMPTPEAFAAMGRFNDELVAAGVMVSGDGIKPTSAGVRIGFDGDDRTVRQGPFPVAETVAGFWIWEVASLEEAIAWGRRCPNPMPGPSEIEIRPLFAEADFAGIA